MLWNLGGLSFALVCINAYFALLMVLPIKRYQQTEMCGGSSQQDLEMT